MFGEVFICQFPFTSGAASKIRSALVLFDLIVERDVNAALADKLDELIDLLSARAGDSKR
jgi:hypothetical protein